MAAVRSVPSLPRSLRRTAHSRPHSSLVSTSGRSPRSRTLRIADPVVGAHWAVGAPEGAPSARRNGRSGFAAREAHGCGAGAVVGLDVDETDHSLLDLTPGSLQGRANVLGLFDIFGVAAQGLGHLVIAGVAEVAAGLVAFGVGGPAAVEADHAQERQFVPDRGVELHRVLPEGAVAVQADDLRVGLGGLGADRERQPTPIVPKGPELSRWPGTKVGIDWRPKFKISCPSTERIASRCMKFLSSSHSRSG